MSTVKAVTQRLLFLLRLQIITRRAMRLRTKTTKCNRVCIVLPQTVTSFFKAKFVKGACSRQCSYRCSSHRHLGSEGRLLICIQLSIKVRAAWPAFANPADCCRSRRHKSGRKQQPNLRAELRLVLLRHMYAIIGIVRAFGTCHLRKSRILLMSIGS